MLSYTILLYGVLPSIFYLFFATFPTRSPLDQRVPWLKYLLLTLGIVVCVPFAAMALVTGSSFTAVRLLSSLGGRSVFNLAAAYEFGCFLLGIASLIWNTVKAPSANDRRKTLVMVWGTIVGVGPVLLTSAIALIQHKTFYQYPFWFIGGADHLPVLASAVFRLRRGEISGARDSRAAQTQRALFPGPARIRGINPAGWRRPQH